MKSINIKKNANLLIVKNVGSVPPLPQAFPPCGPYAK